MKNGIKKLLVSESGETNIVAILIILACVIALAALFRELLFQGLQHIHDAIEKFFNSIGIY